MADIEEDFDPGDEELGDEIAEEPDGEDEIVEDEDEIELESADISVEEVIEAEDESDLVEEEFDREDEEVPLDKLLEQRTGGAPLAPDEETGDEAVAPVALDAADRSATGDGVEPKRPGEFTCSSCFLVKHPSQLADPKRMLCRDCV